LRVGSRADVARLKQSAPEKTYTVRFRVAARRSEARWEFAQRLDGSTGPSPKQPDAPPEGTADAMLAGAPAPAEDDARAAECPARISARDRALVLGLAGAALDQRTPWRVAHRRPDLHRRRTVCAVALAASGCGVGAGNGGGGGGVCRGVGGGACDCGEVELVVRAESGTYIKEFVHGDAGRTSPSVAAALGRKCDVLWLDVNEIHDA
jgi:hypothetical protein